MTQDGIVFENNPKFVFFSYEQKFWQDKTNLIRLQRNKHFRYAAFV